MGKLLIIAKPDLVIRRGPGAKMLKEFLSLTKAKIIASRNLVISDDLARKHYKHLSSKPFFDWIIRYITCSETFAFIIETPVQIEEIRQKLGNTMVEKAERESLRGKYGLRAGMNGLHVSESESIAAEEIKLWEESGVLKEGSIQFPLNDYIGRYENSPDNTQGVHDFFSSSGSKEDLRSKPARDFLFNSLKKEAIDVENTTFENFFGIFWEMLG